MSVAFIVDSYTEKKILQKLCYGAPIRMTNLNGVDVSITAIAKAVASLIRLLKGRHFPIVVVFDREGRGESSEALEQSLRRLLGELYDGEEEIIISCPDRMIENWMLGDATYFRNAFGIELPQNFEGENGKSWIRRVLREKNITYDELTVGVGIFCNIDTKVVSSSSKSFNRLQRQANPYCPWLRRLL
jgi:hypothetical protein